MAIARILSTTTALQRGAARRRRGGAQASARRPRKPAAIHFSGAGCSQPFRRAITEEA